MRQTDVLEIKDPIIKRNNKKGAIHFDIYLINLDLYISDHRISEEI